MTVPPERIEALRRAHNRTLPPPDGASGNGHVDLDVGDPLADRRLNVVEILSRPPEPIPWRCELFAADGFLTTLTGRAGEGKSWLALGLALAVERGDGIAGISCEAGRAVYFDAENGPRLIASRLHAAGVKAEAAPVFYDCTGFPFREAAEQFEAAIRAHDAKLAVFDSLRAFSPGARENESDDMGPLVRRFVEIGRTTGCAIVLIHHRPKAEDGAKYRGSSAIEDQTDLMFCLDRNGQDPEKHHRRRIEAVKCRIEEEPGDRWLEIRAVRSLGQVTIDEADPFEGDGADPSPVRTAAGKSLDETLPLGPFPSARAWIAAAGGDPENGTWRKAAKERIDSGRVVKTKAGITLPGVGQPGQPPSPLPDCPRLEAESVDGGRTDETPSPSPARPPVDAFLRTGSELTDQEYIERYRARAREHGWPSP